MKLNESIAYLLGLIVGKGRLQETTMSIEFPCNNPYVYGVALCPSCSYPMTKPPGTDIYNCKNDNCNKTIHKSDIDNFRSRYHQSILIPESVKTTVIEKIQEKIKIKYYVIASKFSTLLILDLPKELHEEIVNCFNGQKDFYSFRIPKLIQNSKTIYKEEFFNGLLDTIGQPNSGNWQPGNSKYGMIQRIYFQIINKNYYLPVDIDNFIRDSFKLPIQTIDWGHPNIRDGNLKEFKAGNPSCYGREHQLKFYPEHYERFRFRLKSKESMFRELIDFNKKASCDTSNIDWLTAVRNKSEIKKSKIKSYHPMIKHHAVPKVLQKQINAQWQINLLLGCKYLKQIKDSCDDPSAFENFGVTEKITNLESKLQEYKKKSLELFEKMGNPKYGDKKKLKTKNNKNMISEIDTYEPLRLWLINYYKKEFNIEIKAFDTSRFTISNYFSSERFMDLEKLNIRPDIFGFKINTNDILIIESKITALSVEDLGQITGYCLVANPSDAFLITNKDISPNLQSIIGHHRDILKYGDKKIKIGILKNNDVNLREL